MKFVNLPFAEQEALRMSSCPLVSFCFLVLHVIWDAFAMFGLGYIYQNFITAVIFVAFTNPYNVGDRVRIDNGEAMYVRNIHTYTTEFVTIHSKPVRPTPIPYLAWFVDCRH